MTRHHQLPQHILAPIAKITSETLRATERLYEDRTALVNSETLRDELGASEWNGQDDKVVYPPRGLKDIADAVCGAVQKLTQKRRVHSLCRTEHRPRQRPAGRVWSAGQFER